MMINPKTVVTIAKGAKSVLLPIATTAITCVISQSAGAMKDMFNAAVANGYDIELGMLKFHRSVTTI